MKTNKIDLGIFKRLSDPQTIKDFDKFLDDLPINAGYNALIAVGMVWLIAGAVLFFTSMETEKLSAVQMQLMQVEALQPPVPSLIYIPVDVKPLKKFSEELSAIYKGISIRSGAGGEVVLSAQDTDYFPQFIAAISYFQHGGRNWRVQVVNMCVGRKCTGEKIYVKLKAEIVKIGEPKKSE